MRTVVLSLVLFLAAASCQQRSQGPDADAGNGQNTEMQERSISEVLDQHASDLMDIEGVNSVGQGQCDGKPCISVGVTQLTDALRKQIPSKLEGYTVQIHEQGAVRAR